MKKATAAEIEHSRFALQSLLKQMEGPEEGDAYLEGLMQAGVTAQQYAEGMTNVAGFMFGLLLSMGFDPVASIETGLDTLALLLDEMTPDENEGN